jgi:hypothetical protein
MPFKSRRIIGQLNAFCFYHSAEGRSSGATSGQNKNVLQPAINRALLQSFYDRFSRNHNLFNWFTNSSLALAASQTENKLRRQAKYLLWMIMQNFSLPLLSELQ